MPTINGREYQHGTLDFKLSVSGTFTVEEFSKISYKQTVEKKPVMNAKGQVIGYTQDNEKIDGSVTWLQSQWKKLKEACAQQFPGVGVGQVRLSASLTYGNDLSDLMTDTIDVVMFQAEARDSQNNQEALEVETPLFLMGVHMHGGDFVNYTPTLPPGF
jgi:hypothetical protein